MRTIRKRVGRVERTVNNIGDHDLAESNAFLRQEVISYLVKSGVPVGSLAAGPSPEARDTRRGGPHTYQEPTMRPDVLAYLDEIDHKPAGGPLGSE